VFDLTDDNQKHISHIDRLNSENDNQRKTIQDQDYNIKNLEGNHLKLNAKIDDLNNNIRSQQSRIHQLEGDVSHLQRTNEESKKTIQKYQVNQNLNFLSLT